MTLAVGVIADDIAPAIARPQRRLSLRRRESGWVSIRPRAAYSTSGKSKPPITPYFVMKVGHVPLIPYFTPGDDAAAGLVQQAIRDAVASGAPIRVVMLKRLGPNVWNSSPLAAMATLEELEETALLFNRSGRAAAPLSDSAIEQLRQRFGARW